MNEIKEAYVSFEVAKLLKEKGFNEPCLSYFWGEENNKEISYTDFPFTNKQLYSDQILRPTHQMACAWLRKVHNIFIIIEPHMYDYINERNASCVASLWQGDNYYENILSKDYPTYEDTVEAAIKYSLENLIK